ncbi:thioesterase family protein [Streptomyces sp. SID6673]|nr:thioesterase family protein [Streptomyces sp. SID11726]NEB27148.1 thioesterase family protein [Streptomyces sp. SID6673]
MPTYFTSADGETLTPTKWAGSPWSEKQISGPVVCGAFARALERHVPPDFIPIRLTVDMFSPVLKQPFTVDTEVMRKGSRIVVVDAEIVQDGKPRARAAAVIAAAADDPRGETWHAPVDELLTPPERTARDGGDVPLFRSGDQDWSTDYLGNQNALRKSVWQDQGHLIEGEESSGFVRAAMVAENTSMVCNWGSEGVGFINSDLTVALSRMPHSADFGLLAIDQLMGRGVAVGSAYLFDRDGAFGIATVSALSNVRRQLDLASLAEEHGWDNRGDAEGGPTPP